MNTSLSPIKIAFEQTPKHTRDLIRTHAKNTKYSWVWIVLSAGLLAFSLRPLFEAEQPLLMLLTIVVVAVPTLLLWYLLVRWMRKKQAKNKELYGYREITFSPEQIQIKTPHSETTYQWHGIIKKIESKCAYFLYITNIQAFIVPKDAFLNEADHLAFEQWCQVKIGSSERALEALVG